MGRKAELSTLKSLFRLTGIPGIFGRSFHWRIKTLLVASESDQSVTGMRMFTT